MATLLLTGAGARAEVYTYTVDPLRSQLQFSGRIAGIDAEAQTPGSDTTRYSGSLLADVTATTLTIPVNAPFFFFTFANSDTPLTATGQIVATRVIPEPATAATFAAAAGVAGMLRRRRPSRK